MPKTTANAVQTWNLGELLAVLCQVAQDAGEPEPGTQGAEAHRIAHEPPATDLE